MTGWWLTLALGLVVLTVGATPGKNLKGPAALPVGVAVASCVLLTYQAATSTSDVIDRYLYSRDFVLLAEQSVPMVEVTMTTDVGFVTILWILSQILPLQDSWLFGSIALIVSANLTVAYRILMPWWGVAMAWFVTLHMGLALAYSTVTIRHGLALSVLLVGFAIYASRARFGMIAIILIVIAGTMHWSAVAFGMALIACAWRGLPTRRLWHAWWILVLLFLLNAQKILVGSLAERVPALDEYTSEFVVAQYGNAGNRKVFLASMVILATIAWAGSRLDTSLQQDRIVRVWLAWSSLYLLFGYVAYSDRLAVWAWFLAPILLWHPLSRVRGTNGVKEIAAVATVIVFTSLGLIS